MTEPLTCIYPEWAAPERVRALVTTRAGGVSVGPWDALNLATHVEDNPSHVAENRRLLMTSQTLPAEPLWLNQVHGTDVVNAEAAKPDHTADAVVSFLPQTVCAVMTADCLPVLFCDAGGTRVAAAHAGWRGLLGGVLEATVKAMDIAPASILAWLGPAIGPQAFEVGGEVRQAFVEKDLAAAEAFAPSDTDGRYLADLYALARQRLKSMGLNNISGGDYCTYSDASRFFSYRRSGRCGRMASLIWLADKGGDEIV